MRGNQKVKKDLYCHNCGSPLKGDENFCPYCGQKNDISPLSISKFASSLIDNFFNLDNKIWRSIIFLIKSPGKVPKEYIAGKRVTYSNPFRFLLQLSILYFLLSGLIHFFTKKDIFKLNVDPALKKEITQIPEKFFKQLDSIDRLIYFTQSLENPRLSKEYKDSLIQNILYVKLKKASFPTDSLSENVSINLQSPESQFHAYLKNKNIDYEYFPQLQNPREFEKQNIFEKTAQLAGLVSQEPYRYMENREILKHLQVSPDFSNKLAVFLPKRISLIFSDKRNFKQYRQAIISKITLALFFILPLFGLLVYLNYKNKGYSYTENLIHIFYLQSLYFLILILGLFIDFLPQSLSNWIILGLNLVFVWYLVKSFADFYGDNTKTAFLKVGFFILPAYMFFAATGFLIISLLALFFT